jgi:hypothetical protein
MKRSQEKPFPGNGKVTDGANGCNEVTGNGSDLILEMEALRAFYFQPLAME